MDPRTLGLIGGGLGGLVQAGAGAYAAYQQRLAARDQLMATQRAQGAITDAYGQAQGYQQPYLAAGQEGLDRMRYGDYNTAVPGQPTMPGPYQPESFNYQTDPGMAYRMQTGQQAINTSAAGAGTGLSGATLKAMAKFGQDLGSQEYGAAYSRYNQDRGAGLAGYQTNLGRANDIWGQQRDIYTMGNQQADQRYGRAQDLGTMGQVAAGNMSNMATGYGSDLAGLYGMQGQIQAQGRTAPAQTWLDTAGNIANTGLDALSLSQLSKGTKKGSGNASIA